MPNEGLPSKKGSPSKNTDIMKEKYEIAKIKIEFDTDFDIIQNEISELFKADFDKTDEIFRMSLGDIKVGENPVFSTINKTVYRDKDGYKTVYYDPLLKREHFTIDDKGKCILNRQCSLEAKEIIHFWEYIDLPHVMLKNDRLLLHSAFIIFNGKAILFCGRSGIGKSTQADLWKIHNGAYIVNGDKAVVYIENDKTIAASVPVSGTSGICKNKTAEIAAIVFLEQNKTDTVKLLSPANALGLLLSNSLIDNHFDGELNKAVDLCCKICLNTKLLFFKCTKTINAVKALEEAIK